MAERYVVGAMEHVLVLLLFALSAYPSSVYDPTGTHHLFLTRETAHKRNSHPGQPAKYPSSQSSKPKQAARPAQLPRKVELIPPHEKYEKGPSLNLQDRLYPPRNPLQRYHVRYPSVGSSYQISIVSLAMPGRNVQCRVSGVGCQMYWSGEVGRQSPLVMGNEKMRDMRATPLDYIYCRESILVSTYISTFESTHLYSTRPTASLRTTAVQRCKCELRTYGLVRLSCRLTHAGDATSSHLVSGTRTALSVISPTLPSRPNTEEHRPDTNGHDPNGLSVLSRLATRGLSRTSRTYQVHTQPLGRGITMNYGLWTKRICTR